MLTSDDPTAMRIGEVIAASTSELTAQCYQVYEAPPLGRLVRCGENTPAYAIVCEASTQSLDPSRHIIPRGQTVATEADVFATNPQLKRLLYTQFRALIVGFADEQKVLRHYLPSSVPRIYGFVHDCTADEVFQFTQSVDFLPLLLAAPISAPDDVIASFLRQAADVHPNPQEFLITAGKTLAIALTGQLPRLNTILGRLQ